MEWARFFVYFALLIGSISAALKPRVIGGNDADIKDFPFQASLRARTHLFCGGTIISPKHILTAAHCFTSNLHALIVPPYTYVRVHTGTTSSRETGNAHRIAAVTIHPGWSMIKIVGNDIAVVTLVDEIRFDEKQQKAELPDRDIVSHTRARLSGWGCLSQDKSRGPSVQLQKLPMDILDNGRCQSQIAFPVQKSEICAWHSVGHGCGWGDSGGPLSIDKHVVGILSWVVDGLCGMGKPEVFTNVYSHRDFILSVMNK